MKNLGIVSVALVLAGIVTAAISVDAQAPPPGLSLRASRQAARPTTNGISPQWRGGFLVSFVPVVENRSANLFLWNEDGRQVLAASIWPSESARVVLFDVSGVPGVGAVAAGYAQSATGVVSYFLAKVDLQGQTQRIIQTNPFIPSRVCATDDGGVWAFGKPDGPELNPSRSPADKVGWLRQYSFESGLMASFFSRSDFKNHRSPASSIPGEWIFLVCGKEKVGLWSGRTREWITVKRQNGEVEKLPWKEPPGYEVNSVAMTDDGRVFASLISNDGRGYDEGIRQLLVNEASRTATWSMATEEDPGAAPATHLYGADGNKLVHARKLRASEMFWSVPQ